MTAKSSPKRNALSAAEETLGGPEADEQIERERRAGRPAGVAALLAGTLLLAGTILGQRARGDDAFDFYLNIDEDPSLVIVPNILQAIGYLLAGYALWYLVRLTAARRSEGSRLARVTAVLGPIGTALSLVLTAIAIVEIAGMAADVAPVPRGEEARDDVLQDLQEGSGIVTAAAATAFFGRLLLGIALLVAALNAMRTGLLSRVTGIFGVVAGVAVALLGGFGSIVLAFWLAALGSLFLDRWPRPRGPAWDVVEPIPWPSALDQRVGETETETETDAGPEPELEEDEAAAAPHPVSKKRKKKKRR